jgi:ABC-type multidrug transport system fused ATPase/permease subunit
MEQIIEAAKQAHIHDFICSLSQVSSQIIKVYH